MTFVVSLAQAASTVLLIVALGWAALAVIQSSLGKAPIPGNFTLLFAALTTGILVVVFGFSVFKSGGHTGSWAMVLPAVAAVWAWPARDVGEGGSADRKSAAFLGVSLLASLLWFAPATLAGPDLVVSPLPRDDAFYVTVVEALLARGIETTDSLEALLPGSMTRPKVYHYFELWLGAFIAWLWAIPPAVALRLHADAILLTTVMAGVATMLISLRGFSRKVLATALLLPFITWWVPTAITDHTIFREARIWTELLVIAGTPKLLPGYIFGIVGIAGLLFQHPVLAVAGGSLAACANISFAPLMSGLLVGAALQGHWKGLACAKFWGLVTLAAMGPLLFMASFQFSGGALVSLAAGPLDAFGLKDLRTSRNILLKSILYGGFFFGLPILAAIGIDNLIRRLRTTLVRPAMVAALVTFAVGLLIWSILHRWVNSVQFFMNPAVVIGNLACVLAFGSRVSDRRLRTAAGVAWILGGLSWLGCVSAIGRPTGGDEQYLDAIRREGPFSPRVGGLVISVEAANRRPRWELGALILTPGSLTVGTCCAGAIPLVDLGPLVAGDEEIERQWKEATFVRFARDLSLDLTDPEALEEAQLLFANHHRLRFVVVAGRTPVPDWVSSRAERSHTDRVSGERFFVVRMEGKAR